MDYKYETITRITVDSIWLENYSEEKRLHVDHKRETGREKQY